MHYHIIVRETDTINLIYIFGGSTDRTPSLPDLIGVYKGINSTDFFFISKERAIFLITQMFMAIKKPIDLGNKYDTITKIISQLEPFEFSPDKGVFCYLNGLDKDIQEYMNINKIKPIDLSKIFDLN